MDFDISTLLYILFAVGYYVFFSGRKKQKNRPQTRPSERTRDVEQTTQRERRPTFEELLEEFTGAKTFEERKEPEPIPVKKEEPPVEESKPFVRSFERVEHRSMDTEFGRFEEFDDEEYETGILNDLRDPDTARKAFIYSEIFKRKY